MAMSFIEFNQQFNPANVGLAMLINDINPLMQRFPVKKESGLVHRYGAVTFEGGVATRAFNAPFPDTKPSVTTPGNERMIVIGAAARTDTVLEEASGTKARASEVARRTRVVARAMNKQILNGDGLAAQNDLVGFHDRLAGSQLIIAGANGAPLTLDLFHQMIDAVEDQGAGRFVYMNRTMFRKLRNLLIAAASGITLSEVATGVIKYEDVDLLIAGKDENGADLLQFTETQGTSTAATSIYCFAPGTAEDFTGVQTVMMGNSIQTVPEGIRDSHYVDVVQAVFGVAMYHPKAASRLAGLTNA